MLFSSLKVERRGADALIQRPLNVPVATVVFGLLWREVDVSEFEDDL